MSIIKFLVPSILCFLLFNKVTQANQPFNAAVVEYYPIQDPNITPNERLLNNSNAYINILSKIASHQEIDIIVFPESTLTTNAPIQTRVDILPYSVEIQDDFNLKSLCYDEHFSATSSFLTNLACAAKKFSTYLVVNLVERSLCKNDPKKCSKDGWDFYNTNVVFNRDGAVIARYRKFNLFGEYFFNQTSTPDFSIFETDFGVKFGLFTCFDILFKTPTLHLIRDYGINHIVYPTMWFSELPFLTALQAQQMWAFEVDAVFYASGANNAELGSGGTGIFQGRSGPLIFDITQRENSKAYVSMISKTASSLVNEPSDNKQIDEMARDMDNFYFKTDDLTAYTSEPLKHSEKINTVLCNGDDGINKLCCSFNLDLKWDSKILGDNKNHYNYRMVAYSGIRSFSGVYNGGVEICGIVACVDKSIDSCNTRFKNYDDVSWPLTFNKISIAANFTEDSNKIQFANSLLSSIRPLPVNAIEWSNQHFINGTIKERVYKLKEPQNRLMTFAIYGRNFLNDGPPF